MVPQTLLTLKTAGFHIHFNNEELKHQEPPYLEFGAWQETAQIYHRSFLNQVKILKPLDTLLLLLEI